MEDTDTFNKPSFDGRLEYFKVLKQYQMNIALASATADFVLWFRMLNGIYAYVLGFIKKSDAEAIKKDLNNIKKNINMLSVARPSNQIAFMIDYKLQEITENIYVASKHLMLPMDTENKDDFNEEDLLEGSE